MSSNFNRSKQGLVIIDSDQWLIDLARSTLAVTQTPFLRIQSNASFRNSWKRFNNAPFFIIHWENQLRAAGALIEEFLEIDGDNDILNKVVIITTNPIHEDVVYFSELGIKRVIRVRQREQDVPRATSEITSNLKSIMSPTKVTSEEYLWRRIQSQIDGLPDDFSEEQLSAIEAAIEFAVAQATPADKKGSARELDAKAAVQAKRKNFPAATRLAQAALEINPNFFRAWNTLIEIKRAMGDHNAAYALLQKMQLHNRNSVRRLVALGEEQLSLNEIEKAEHYFLSALDRDARSAKALNGMAEIMFTREQLDEASRLLSKSTMVDKFAKKLNNQGIELVRDKNFERALQHYIKAQHVLPQSNKSPQLLFNMALCYAKWGRQEMAAKFLHLAIIKNPGYEKARKLLVDLQSQAGSSLVIDPDAA